MSETGIAIAGFCYILAAAGYIRNGNYSMALVFVSYALANVGLILVGLKGAE